MMNAGVISGRTASFVVAAVLFYGNIAFVVNAFHATNFLQPPSCSSSKMLSRPFGDACIARSKLQNRQSRGNEPRRRRGGWLFVAVADTSTNAASADELGDGDAMIPPEVFFPPVESQYFDEEKEGFVSTPTETTKRGKKRRAIQRMRQKYFSRPIESRLARTILFPMRVLIWKPLWMAMDIFIDRLGETMVLDNGNSSTGSFDSEETIDVSTAPDEVATITAPDTSSVETKEDDMAISETGSITEATSHTAIQNEPVDSATPQSAANPEAVEETVEEEEEDTPLDADMETPRGDRWSVAALGVDLSGKWELIVTNDFKKKYDRYLEGLGQPKIVRSVALSGPVISKTMEELIQIDQGHSLIIRGTNVRGTWDRTLVASGSTKHSEKFEPLITPIRTVDQELVEAEAWWEDEGKAHVSWMRGVTMYGGGSFYSKRYFEKKEHEDDETVYACEGFFEFNDPKKENNELTWRFRRMAK